MRLFRRLIGMLSAVAGLIGLLLCIAGMIGCWVGYSELLERVDRTFGRADELFVKANEHLGQAGGRLRQTQTELAAIKKREADLAAQPPEEKTARRALSRKSLESVNPKLGEAREVLVQATETALVVNGILDALGELPFVERLNIDADRLKSTSSQLSEVIDRSNKVAALLAKTAPPNDADVSNESSRIVDSLDRIVTSVDGAGDRIDKARGKVQEAHARIKYWLKMTALIVTGVLLWIGFGQLSLMIHGGKMVRK